jgi:hypothetical protein
MPQQGKDTVVWPETDNPLQWTFDYFTFSHNRQHPFKGAVHFVITRKDADAKIVRFLQIFQFL